MNLDGQRRGHTSVIAKLRWWSDTAYDRVRMFARTGAIAQLLIYALVQQVGLDLIAEPRYASKGTLSPIKLK
jgi:hypothetical protein